MDCVYLWGYQYIYTYKRRFLRHVEITLISKCFILPRLIMDIVKVDSVLLLKHSIIILMWRWRHKFLQKCRYLGAVLQGFIYIYIYIYIVTVLRKSHANFKPTNVNLGCAIYSQSQSMPNIYRYALHNDVSVNDGPHIRPRLTFRPRSFAHRLRLRVLYGSQKKQWLFPYTTLNGLFL